MSDPLLQVRHLSKKFRVPPRGHDTARTADLREWLGGAAGRLGGGWGRRRQNQEPDEFWALRDVSFELARGEVVGVVGRNGAGKSTLLKILSRIIRPTSGEARVWGSMAGLLEVGTGFHPDLTGRENILMNGALLGFTRPRMLSLMDRIAEFAGVERFLDLPVKRYSNGMQVRLGYAVAAHLEPDLLLVDEVLAVGDAAFQKKCLAQLQGLANGRRSVLLVSHDLSLIRQFCSRALLMENGRLTMDGPAPDILAAYLGADAQPGRRRWDARDAPGGRQGRLLEISVAGESCGMGAALRSDAALRFGIHFELTEEAPDFCAGLEIHSESGELVLAAYSDQDADACPPGACSAGAHWWRCDLPAGLLGSGRYFVSVRLVSLGRFWIVKEDAVLTFEILNAGQERWLAAHPARRKLRRAPVAPETRWSRSAPETR
jgi:lipopolysaccharide transport system ATP-binding protein